MSEAMENRELNEIIRLFFEQRPSRCEIKNTSHGDADFRETVIVQWPAGGKHVIKIADNDFTSPQKIWQWKRCVQRHRQLGYFCPDILPSLQGDFPTVSYKGRSCVAYAEEFCPYTVAEERKPFDRKWADAAWLMIAKVAAMHFDDCDHPSAYCLFETFCPSDEVDEVMENALEWKQYAQSLPEAFQPQVRRIWDRWMANRNRLEEIYGRLPTSVFQADLNPSNLLVDDCGEFVGVLDFNLSGRDVFLNYLFREIHWQYDEAYLLETLRRVSRIYRFSDLEKQAAPLLYRCLKPLWFTENKKLQDAKADERAIRLCLDRTEELQTREVDFAAYMSEGEKG